LIFHDFFLQILRKFLTNCRAQRGKFFSQKIIILGFMISFGERN
jgi:hypothetical protein